jgi:hypothetical protein
MFYIASVYIAAVHTLKSERGNLLSAYDREWSTYFMSKNTTITEYVKHSTTILVQLERESTINILLQLEST